MILNLVRLGKKSANHSKSKFPFMLAQGRAFRFWAMKHSFNYRRAFFNFLQVFFLGWAVCYFLAACWLMAVLGFGGYFVLLDFHTLIHPFIWFLPLLVASWSAFRRGLIVEVDDDPKQD